MKNGGLPQQGLPISDEFQETSDLDGKTYKVQYFERAVFEYHPENQAPYDVLLSQLGTFRYKQKYQQRPVPGTPISTPGGPTPTIDAPSPSATPAGPCADVPASPPDWVIKPSNCERVGTHFFVALNAIDDRTILTVIGPDGQPVGLPAVLPLFRTFMMTFDVDTTQDGFRPGIFTFVLVGQNRHERVEGYVKLLP
jgi:hypothetical protein